MKKLALAMFISVLAVSCAQRSITPMSGNAEKLDKAKSILVVTAKDGAYDKTVYQGTGAEFATLVMAEFSKYAKHCDLAPNSDLAAAQAMAKEKGASYVAVPEIMHYEDRNTVWSGRPDQISVKVSVYDAATGTLLNSSMLSANSSSATFTSNRPMELVTEPLGSMVKSFY